jgi:tetratricopeptide (TPR) repeat protein
MASAVLCPACGAKIKEGRANCLRCGESLTGATPEPSAPSASQHPAVATPTDPRHIGAAVLSLVLLLVGVAYVRSAQEDALKPATAVARTAAPPATPNAPPKPEPGDERPFMDSEARGNAGYATGDMTAAIKGYGAAVEKNPEDLTALNNLGQVLVRAGRPAEAIPYFERATKLNDRDWAPRFNMARAYGELGDWRRAIAEYRTAATLMPDDYVTHFNLARAYHKVGEEELAVETYQRAIVLAPGEPSFRLALGISYEQLKKKAEAARAYEEYLELAPEAPDAVAVKAKIESLKAAPPA